MSKYINAKYLVLFIMSLMNLLFVHYYFLLTIDLESKEACFGFLNRLKLVHRATNLFDSRTLAIHPASTIFGLFPERQLEQMDVRQTTIRLSIGLEDPDDILDDIRQAIG